jgi:plastocyanin
MMNNARPHARRLGLLVVACTALAACASDQTTNPEGTPPANQVWVQDNRFVPDSIAINDGESVTFVWKGVNLHSIVFDDHAISSITPRVSGEVAVTSPSTGTYTYYCSIHGRSIMSGKVVVQPVAPTGGPGD